MPLRMVYAPFTHSLWAAIYGDKYDLTAMCNIRVCFLFQLLQPQGRLLLSMPSARPEWCTRSPRTAAWGILTTVAAMTPELDRQVIPRWICLLLDIIMWLLICLNWITVCISIHQEAEAGFGEAAVIMRRLERRSPNSSWTRWKTGMTRAQQSTCTTTRQADW